MRTLLPALLAALTLSCGSARRTVRADAPQQWFRITLGRADAEPADWSGSIQVSGGRLAALHSVRFDKDDRLDTPHASWTCHTRRDVVADPRDWFVGAKHIVPTNLAPRQAPMLDNAILAAIESGSEIRVSTAQGEFRFAPAAVRFGAPVALLTGRVEVERVPQPANLTAADGFEDDEPTLAVDSQNNAWIAWLAYRAERETLTVARADGSARQTVAQGEFFRPALVPGYLAVSNVRAGQHIQGDIFAGPGKPRLEIRIEGTGAIEQVEVIRNNRFVFSEKPAKSQVEIRYEDTDPQPGESYYYVRVQQRNGQMAWSSPIWIRR